MRAAYLFSLAIGLSIFSSTAFASTCEPVAEKAHVSAVYPTADRLPENLLRFYVYFSKPMQREDILSSVYLEDKEGKRLQGVFLITNLHSGVQTVHASHYCLTRVV